MDYTKLTEYYKMIHPDLCEFRMRKEFEKNIQTAKYTDIEILKCIEINDLAGLCKRYEMGYTWGCYKYFLVDLCVYFKRYKILDHLIKIKQINRDVNEAFARLDTDDNWKRLRVHQPVVCDSLRAFYHNLGHVSEEKIIFHRFHRCMRDISNVRSI